MNHATRHSDISGVVAGGASVKTAQELAPHSQPELTIGLYAHVRLREMKDSLPILPGEISPRKPWRQSRRQCACRENDDRQDERVAIVCIQATQSESSDVDSNRLEQSTNCDQNERAPADCDERRRWESNPRWRICKQPSSSKSPAETAVSELGAALGAAVDARLARIIAAWPTLPDAIRRAMLALIG